MRGELDPVQSKVNLLLFDKPFAGTLVSSILIHEDEIETFRGNRNVDTEHVRVPG